jgi:hypothetical protein
MLGGGSPLAQLLVQALSFYVLSFLVLIFLMREL